MTDARGGDPADALGGGAAGDPGGGGPVGGGPAGAMARALDGNAAAGALAEIFAAEMTVAITTCGTCRDQRPLAELRAYLDGPGVVLCCQTCGAIQLRLVRGPQHAWLELRGVQVVQVPMP